MSYRKPCIIVLLGLAILLGCSSNPVSPKLKIDNNLRKLNNWQHSNHMLWGQYKLYFNAAHDEVSVSKKRNGQIHLNALKFLESDCDDCLTVYPPHNNGDGTIDLKVKIKHPFYGFPQYTGFDVKGIVIFDGSLVLDSGPPDTGDCFPPLFRVSWKEMGDPEVLNPDGYSYRWNLWWDSGNAAPIFNYYQGMYSKGEPNAHLNAYLDFYTHDERHMFSSIGEVERTYTIWLPPGEEVTAGYSIDACWEPPTVTPVTDPLNDFPPSANQSEPYHFNLVVNEGQPITSCQEDTHYNCDKLRIEIQQWDKFTINEVSLVLEDPGLGESPIQDVCGDEYPDSYGIVYGQYPYCDPDFENGNHRGVMGGFQKVGPGPRYDYVFDVFDVLKDI